MSDLLKRYQLLQQEQQKAQQNVLILRKNLTDAKNNLNKLLGHIDELSFILNEQNKKDESNEQADSEVTQ